MAQFAFVKFHDIESGTGGSPTATFVFKVVWVGDQLAGGSLNEGYEVRVTVSRAVTNTQLANAVRPAVIALANSLGYPSLTDADIRLVGGAVF